MLNVVCFQLFSWRSFTHVSVIDLAFVHLKRWCACAKDHLDPSLNKHNTHSYTNKCFVFSAVRLLIGTSKWFTLFQGVPLPFTHPLILQANTKPSFRKKVMVGLLGFFVVLPLVLICYSLQYVLERLGEFCLSFFRKQIYVLVGSIARSSVPDTPHY